MPFFSLVVGLTMFLTFSWQAPPMVTSVVVFGDAEVSTMLTANKTVPASFFTNCVRAPLTVVLNSQSTLDWQMTNSTATPTCSDSVQTWNMTQPQRLRWNTTPVDVKVQFLNAFNTFRSYALQKPTVSCVVSGLTPTTAAPYTGVSAAPDPANPDRYLIKLLQQPGGGSSNGQE